MTLRLATLRACAALALLAPFTSCGDGGTEPGARVPAAIEMSPDSLRFTALQETADVSATVVDESGSVLADAEVAWSVEDATVVRHLGGGSFQALANGVTSITATMVGRPSLARTARVRVAQEVAQVAASPDSGTLFGKGAYVPLRAAASDALGNPMQLLPSDFEWSSSDPAVATVAAMSAPDPSILAAATAVGSGSAWIRVVAGGKKDSARVRVYASTPASVEKIAGDGQTDSVGMALPVSPAVRVLDAAGAPAPGVFVRFTVASGGGLLNGTSMMTTGLDGIARAGVWTLGTRAGVNTFTATAGTTFIGTQISDTLPPVTFTATGTPRRAFGIHPAAWIQNGVAGVPFASPFVARVIDPFNNGVPGAMVTWRSQGGTFTPASGPTDSSGYARTQFTPGVGSPYQLVHATTPGLDSAEFFITVDPATLGVWGPAFIGAGLQDSVLVELGASTPDGHVVRIATADPAVALVSPNASTPGQASIDVPVRAGTSRLWVWVQAVGSPSSPQDTLETSLLATSAGFRDGGNRVFVVAPAVEIADLAPTTTVGAPDDPFIVRVGQPNPSFGAPVPYNVERLQAVRAGSAPLRFTVTTGDPTKATLVASAGEQSTVTVEIAAGQSSSPASGNGSVAVRPVSPTSSAIPITVTGPAGFTASTLATRTVFVYP